MTQIVMMMTQIVMMMTQIVMMMTKLIGKALIISNSGMTRQECEDKIQRMLLVKAGAVKPELPDYNDMRRYQVLEINLNDGTTVKRLVKTGTNLKIVGKEDLFEELYEIHLSTGVYVLQRWGGDI